MVLVLRNTGDMIFQADTSENILCQTLYGYISIYVNTFTWEAVMNVYYIKKFRGVYADSSKCKQSVDYQWRTCSRL